MSAHVSWQARTLWKITNFILTERIGKVKKEKEVCECCDRTEKLDVSEYARLCRVDARMDALISYITFF